MTQLGNWDPSKAVCVPPYSGGKSASTDARIDLAGTDWQLPDVERDGVLTAEHAVRVQVHSQRNGWQGMFSPSHFPHFISRVCEWPLLMWLNG